MRKISTFTSLIILASTLALSHAGAASVKSGATCTKSGLTSTVSNVKFTCTKSGKKLVWDKGVLLANPPTPSSSPTPTPTNTSNVYVAKDQKTVRRLYATEGCSNPSNTTFVIQVKSGPLWLPVEPLDSGWIQKGCSDPAFGTKNSLPWVNVHLDGGTTYRWLYTGEVNIKAHDGQGHGVSAEITLPVFTPPPPAVIPIPIALPVVQREITFANILDNVEKVAQVAFESAQKIYLANTAPTGMKSMIWIGPNTIPAGTTSEEERIAKAMKFWSGFNQPKSIGLFFFNTQDEPLAEIAYNKWRNDNNVTGGNPASMMRNLCLPNMGLGATPTEMLKDCGAANAGVIDTNGNAVGNFGVPNEASERAKPYRQGGIEIHEFTHMVQTANPRNATDPTILLPEENYTCWLAEGQAHFVGKALASNSYKDYLQERNGEAKYRTASNNLVPPRDLAGVSAYLFKSCNDYDWGYATGMLAVEALSAIGGANSTMALYAEQAKGHTFSESFKLVYGISWEQAIPILAQVIVKDYSVPSMNG